MDHTSVLDKLIQLMNSIKIMKEKRLFLLSMNEIVCCTQKATKISKKNNK